MFRKIKKLYFKIYHLFKLIGMFLVVFGLCNRVYAEEKYYCSKSVNKIVTGNFITGYQNPFGTSKPVTYWTITYDGIIEVKEDTSYTFKFMSNPVAASAKRVTFMFYNENKEYISYNDARTTINNYYRNITTPTGTKYIILGLYNVTQENANNVTSVLYEGETYKTNESITEPIINYEQCQEVEPEPEDNIYSGFLTIYFDRITYLAEGFTNNPYLIAMVGIIFGFVVLDILLKILQIRRRK